MATVMYKAFTVFKARTETKAVVLPRPICSDLAGWGWEVPPASEVWH